MLAFHAHPVAHVEATSFLSAPFPDPIPFRTRPAMAESRCSVQSRRPRDGVLQEGVHILLNLRPNELVVIHCQRTREAPQILKRNYC
jgi:hypothetical protein